MSLDDVPVVGQLLVTIGALADVLLQGGEFVIGLLAFSMTHLGMLLPILRYADGLTAVVPFLSSDMLGILSNAAIGALLLLNVLRVVDSYRNQ